MNQVEPAELLFRLRALNKKLGVTSEFPTSKELMMKAIQSPVAVDVQEYWNILQVLMAKQPVQKLQGTVKVVPGGEVVPDVVPGGEVVVVPSLPLPSPSPSPLPVLETNVSKLEKDIGKRLLVLEKYTKLPVPEKWYDYSKLSKVLKGYMVDTLPQVYNAKVSDFERLKSVGDVAGLQDLFSNLVNETVYLFSLVYSAFNLFHGRSVKDLGFSLNELTILFGCIEQKLSEDESKPLEYLSNMLNLCLLRGLCIELGKDWLWRPYRFRALLTRLWNASRNKDHKKFFMDVLDELSGLCGKQMVLTSASCMEAFDMARSIMNNVSRLWKFLLTSKLPGAEERLLSVPKNAEEFLLILMNLEQSYMNRQEGDVSRPSSFMLSKARTLFSLSFMLLTAAIGATALGGVDVFSSASPKITKVSIHPNSTLTKEIVLNPFNSSNFLPVSETCSNFYSTNLNMKVLTSTSFVLKGEEKSGLSTALRCVQPNVFVVDISPVIDKLDNITSNEDFYKFEVGQVARQIVNHPVTSFGDVMERDKTFYEERVFEVLEGLCRYFPEDATKEELNKLATHVKLVVDSICSQFADCSEAVSSDTILQDTQSLGRKGALEILERARVVSGNIDDNSTQNAFILLTSLADHIKKIYGKTLALRLDASNITDNSFDYQKLADFALTFETQGAAMDRLLLYQYAFPSDKGIVFPMENQKLPVQELVWNPQQLQDLKNMQTLQNSK